MGKKEKFTFAIRLQSVLLVKYEGLSLRAVGRLVRADHKEVRRWVALYEHHGKSGLCREQRNYSGNFKLSVVLYMRENELSLFETAVRFRIPSERTVRNWNNLYDKFGSSGFLSNEHVKMKKAVKSTVIKSEKTKEELLAELEYLRAENAYLKKLRALVEERIARENKSGQEPSKD